MIVAKLLWKNLKIEQTSFFDGTSPKLLQSLDVDN